MAINQISLPYETGSDRCTSRLYSPVSRSYDFLPNCISLDIFYADLRRVTDHFTKDQLRINCGKVLQLSIYDSFEVSEHLERYFPHVELVTRSCSNKS